MLDITRNMLDLRDQVNFIVYENHDKKYNSIHRFHYDIEKG